jgi:hypothetical protein
MKPVTVNYLLAMEKSLRERLSQLNELKIASSKRTYWSESDKVEEPTYPIKQIDSKITSINKALFEINHKVKESNAKTTIEIDIDYNTLVSEIE